MKTLNNILTLEGNETFKDENELIDKILYYREHPEEREKSQEKVRNAV